uniref:ARID domain-containing protein n=1 Tax=Petromyzon marinus TaxID=7757 RepID=S4RXN4_PETMA
EKTAEEENFLRELHGFMRTRKTPIGRIPNLGFKQVDLWVMFRAVQELGGYEAVTSQRLWKQIYDTLGGNRGSTSAATCTRRHYERLILPYERHVKGEEDKPLPPPVKPRKRSDASSSSGDKKKQQQSEEEEEEEATMTAEEKFSDFGPARCATDAGSAAREGQPQAADDGGPELSSLAAEGGPAKNGMTAATGLAAPSPQPVAGAGGGGNGGGPGAMSPLARKKLLAQVSAMKPVGAAPPLALRGGGGADAPDAHSPPSPLNVAASSGKRPTVIQHVHLGPGAGREADEMAGFDPA